MLLLFTICSLNIWVCSKDFGSLSHKWKVVCEMLYSVCCKKIGQVLFFCAVYFSVSFVFLFLLLMVSRDAKDLIFHPRVTYISQSQRAVLFPEALIHWCFIASNQSLLDTGIFHLRQIRWYWFIQTLENYLYVSF